MGNEPSTEPVTQSPIQAGLEHLQVSGMGTT